MCPIIPERLQRYEVKRFLGEGSNHRPPLEQAIDIAEETCRGLEFAHSRGIVHRDLKPGNSGFITEGAWW